MQTRTVRARGIAYSPALDGLRGLCIAAVLLYHLSPAGWFRGGFLGVSVFFTLSGFLITRNLLEETATTGRVDIVRFVSRRMQRLAPAALATILVVVLVTKLTERGWSSLGLDRNAIAAVWSATNWQIIESGRTNVLLILGPLAPMWSLAVEEQFYLGIALVFLIVRSRRAARSLGLVFVVIAVGSAVVAARLGDYAPRLEFGTDTRAGEVALGALLAAVAARRPALFTRSVGTNRTVGWICLAALGVAFVGWFDWRAWLFHGWFFVISLLAVGLIVGLVTPGSLATIAAWPPLVALGRISYPLYLVQWPIILITRDPLLGVSGPSAMVVRAVLCVVGAWALHLLVERPLRSRRMPPRRVVVSWFVASIALTALVLAVL